MKWPIGQLPSTRIDYAPRATWQAPGSTSAREAIRCLRLSNQVCCALFVHLFDPLVYRLHLHTQQSSAIRCSLWPSVCACVRWHSPNALHFLTIVCLISSRFSPTPSYPLRMSNAYPV
eukprot:848296-Pleurochrysis_carterae.AAC.5